jgi:hypothetical protein
MSLPRTCYAGRARTAVSSDHEKVKSRRHEEAGIPAIGAAGRRRPRERWKNKPDKTPMACIFAVLCFVFSCFRGQGVAKRAVKLQLPAARFVIFVTFVTFVMKDVGTVSGRQNSTVPAWEWDRVRP